MRNQFSIIITCYNQKDYIGDAIESALSQTGFSRPEVIVVDDGSKDGSAEFIRSYGARVRFVGLEMNGGVAEARNHGAAFAQGEYVVFLDGDDLLVPRALEIYESLIEEFHPAFIVGLAQWFSGVVPRVASMDKETLELIEYESLMARDRGCGIYNGSFVMSRTQFLQVGGWTPGVWHLDGHDLYCKLGYSGKALLLLGPSTMLYRMHGVNSISATRSYTAATRAYLQRERDGFFPGGAEKKSERYARHGGVVVFCVRKLWRAGAYGDALSIAFDGWAMVMSALLQKAQLFVKGKKPVQTRLWRARSDAPSGTAALVGD